MECGKYYLDYRIGKIVGEEDIAYVAPEYYIEVLPSDVLHGTYYYTYEDKTEDLLAVSFTREEMEAYSSKGATFYQFIETLCKRHNFQPVNLVDKHMYICYNDFIRLKK